MRSKILIVTAILGTSIAAPGALASCEYLQHGLNLKMAEYRTYRDRNTARIQELQQSKKKCDAQGLQISLKASSIAAGESCTALGEVASLDHSIEVLGRECETKYLELKRLQAALQAAYVNAHNDMKGALEIIEEDPLMVKYCGQEVEVAKQMGQAFLVLEGNIVDTLTSATIGSKDYATLKDTGRALSASLAAGNRNCGQQAPAGDVQPSRMIATTYGQGSATVTPIGESPRPVSDISGTQKAIADNAKAEAVIGK